MITLAGNINRMSGGFPHSEIHGSKPIPGSPWLNAGYHVLHRLLLPRHPPNALFALDLIQKEQGQRLPLSPSFRVSKAVYLPMPQPAGKLKVTAVSVLDLEQYRFRQSATRMQHATDPMLPYSGTPNDTDVSLSKRCQFSQPGSSGRIRPDAASRDATHPSQDDQTRPKTRLMIV
jgi:hypothetical protein